MVNQPLVSIIINNYNYARFLRDAIDSALNQTYDRTETIVVDDGLLVNGKRRDARWRPFLCVSRGLPASPRTRRSGVYAFSRTCTQVCTCGAPRKNQSIAGPSICQMSHTPSWPMSSFL